MKALALAILASTALSAGALTPDEIDGGARRATSGLRTVIRRLAGDGLAGRDNDTPESTRTQTFLLRRLRRLGAGLDAARIGDDAYRQPFVESGQTGTNLLAVIPGRELPGEYVIVGAHYDHLDTRSAANGACTARGTPGGGVCHGATDNAAGVAAVLAVGRAIRRLPEPPRRSVVLALWDAEEDGLLGSLHYVNHPVVPLGSTVAYVNFDILGARLMPSLAGRTFAIGGETGGAPLQDLVRDAAGAETVAVRQFSYIFGQLRSDYANFVNGGVPTAFFSDATNGCYHTTADRFEIVDFSKLRAQSRIAFRLAATLAETATPPGFVPPNPGFAVFADAVMLSETVHTGLADLGRFSAADQATIERIDAELSQIVSDGPAAFDTGDVVTLLNDAIAAIAAIQRIGCLPL